MTHRVVITGIGAVTPVGNSVADMWDALKNGRSGIGPLTRLNAADFKTSVAGELKDFDPSLYLEPTEIRRLDPNVQFAVAAAEQAVKDSGIVGACEPERIGTYIGSGIGGFQTMTDGLYKLRDGGPRKVSPFVIPMMIANMAAGTVAMRYNLRGATLPVVTACATSTHTVGEAFRAIKHGYSTAIVAGGTEASITPLSVAGFGNSMALAKNPDPALACAPFDKRRDGFVIAEGAAVLVLEEREHAIARGAHIYCEICGYGNTCDAYHITAPDPEAAGITTAIKLACEEAGVNVGEGLYINAHGTSTPLNDKTETLGIKQALGEDAYAAHISSTKSMTGHMLGAAGATEAIVCALSLENGIIPPTINYVEPDPDCDLDYTPNKAQPFDGKWAMSNSLGFGGHNGVLVFKKEERN